MIPRRVKVEGFLCYRDAQVVDLDGCDLWAFSGRNGSGKSAIFDAITFALYGRHRGGAQGAENLIHADENEFAVAFDFDLGAERYRIKRSLHKGGRSERQVYRYEPDEDGNEHWLPVSETNTDAGLVGWVEETVGLQFEVFTSSVLLQQGGAEKLLEAKPKKRYEILTELIDLKRYQRLHKLAESRRADRKALVESLMSQLASSRPIELEAVEAAEARLAEAGAAVASASAERERLVNLEAQAGVWVGLVRRRDQALEGCEKARRLLAESEAIRRDAARLRDLEAVLPRIREAIGRRERIEATTERIDRRAADRQDSARKLGLMACLDEENRKSLEEATREIERDEGRLAEVNARMATLEAPMQRARSARSQRRAIGELERVLASYPSDLEDEVTRLEDDHHRRNDWKAALPSLRSFATARASLVGARSRIETAHGRIAGAEAASRRAGSRLDDLRASASATRFASDEVKVRSTEARTRLDSAQGHLDDFEMLEGARACDRCGQRLTPEHFDDEIARLRSERDMALTSSEAADRVLRKAEDVASATELDKDEAERDHRNAEVGFAESRRELDQAARDAAREAGNCASAFDDLDETFRLAIASEPTTDWPATSFPTPADLEAGDRLRVGLDEVGRSLKEARDRRDALRKDRARRDEAGRALDALGLLPGDEASEDGFAGLAKESTAIGLCLAAHHQAEGSARTSAERMAGLIATLNGQIVEADGLIATDRRLVQEWRDESARSLAEAPEAWRPAIDEADRGQLRDWESEGRSLREKDVEALAADLPRAEASLGQAQSEIDECESQIGRIPEEARSDPEAVSASKGESAKWLAAAEEGRRGRQGELDSLLRDRRARSELESLALEAERSRAVADTLARLLGREGLQRELLRGAEREILDLARPILRDISGGEIDLRLKGDDPEGTDDERALALEALVRTHGSTRIIDVAYLSGSQKFRVAVSLALAIGQYARGIDRPIRAVIIDEGFGCLDRQGRDEMIAELNALRGRLDRIILVSHQEEFADAFSDGYHFEVKEGMTVVRPFHR